MGKTILILGGGMGGVVAANSLRKKLSSDNRVILIDRSGEHFFSPSLLWVLEGLRSPEQLVMNLDRLNLKGIEFHQAEVEAVNLADKKVQAGGRSYSHDYLIIALGAELNYAAIPGLTSDESLYELPGILGAKEKLKDFAGGKAFIVISSAPFKCPAAPYEAALSLNNLFIKSGVRAKTDLRIFTVEAQPMPVAGPVIGATIRTMIEDQGIKYQPKYKLISSDNLKREITFENGEKYDYDLLLVVPPHKAPEIMKEAGLLDENGWIPVNPRTLETKWAGVFAVGDIAGIKLPNGKALPKAGVFAHFEAEVVAKNIADEINGRQPSKEFTGGGACFLEIGSGRAGLAFGNFYGKPSPKVTMLPPMKIWHWTKILFEKWWFWQWF